MVYGAIEAGGTKMVCGLVDDKGEVLERISIPTRQPQETIPQMLSYFENKKMESLGIGCFGPLNLNRKSDKYGSIALTPKKGWANYPIRDDFMQALHVPVGIDTDVNGAALAEVEYGAAKGCENAIYITIGTGVGVGVYCNGGLVHGLVHPEAGHILLTKDPADTFAGGCPFHKNCLEGLASGPAIEKRWGKKAAELAGRPEVWNLEAYYIAQAICDYILVYSPEKIILWGGVMHQEQLFSMVREKVVELLAEYVQHESILEHIDNYIVAPGLGDNPGLIGAALLGRKERERQ